MTAETELTYEYGVRRSSKKPIPKGATPAAPEASANLEVPPLVMDGKPHLPFQLQVEYTGRDGSHCMRVITDTKPVTKDREQAEKGMSIPRFFQAQLFISFPPFLFCCSQISGWEWWGLMRHTMWPTWQWRANTQMQESKLSVANVYSRGQGTDGYYGDDESVKLYIMSLAIQAPTIVYCIPISWKTSSPWRTS